tara:strand:+ start:460 stop:1305 length:846 start_codon:yes stop_codon:yes gene_type:complete
MVEKIFLEKKIKFPKDINKENIILKKLKEIFENEDFFTYFVEEFSRVEKKEHNPNSMKQIEVYKPQIRDLLRLFEFIVLNKRTTILEFGSGWSTLLISIALEKLKKENKNILNEIRRSDPFKVFSIDNEKKFLKITKERIKKYFVDKQGGKNVNYHLADCNICLYNGNYCIEYSSLPVCNPDFIYIDGPDIFNVKGKIKNFSYGHQDIMPIICDILKIEFFLIPGTIILMDGRTANAQFLYQNLKRNWKYYYDRINDQNLFYLDAPSLGKHNDDLLKFYSN